MIYNQIINVALKMVAQFTNEFCGNLLKAITAISIEIFCYYNVSDYRIINAFTFSASNFRRTELKVVVYRFWDIDNIIGKIEEEHTRINREAIVLKLNLFYPECFFWHGKEAFEIVSIEN